MTKDLNKPSQTVGAWPNWLFGGMDDFDWVTTLSRIITKQYSKVLLSLAWKILIGSLSFLDS